MAGEPRSPDLHVDARIARARTLPPEAFTGEDFARRELATLFRASWLLVPERAGEEMRGDPRSLPDLVRRRGAHAPFTLLEKPLFLQRDWQGRLRAFPNVCTHAWHTLVQGPDRARALTCPQHGRQFDAAGRCLGQPGFEGVEGFPAAEDHLPAFPAEPWGPFLFTCLGRPAAPLDEVLAPVRASLARVPLGRFERRPLDGESRELEGNWKQHAWNYLDSLHIPHIHKRPGGLAEAVDLGSYATEVHDHAVLQWAWATRPADGLDPRVLPRALRHAEKRVFALWWFVFPNLALNLYPWGLSVNAFYPVPGKPQRTRFLWTHHVWDDAKYRRRDEAWKLREVDDEDVDALGQVGRGARSGLAPRGRFAPGKEQAPHWFHRRVSLAVGG